MTDEVGKVPGPGDQPKETIEGDVIVLDYGTFQNKRFFKCRLIYRGGRPPTFIGNDFVECEFIFEGSALYTAQFLAALASGKGGKEFVLSMLGIKP